MNIGRIRRSWLGGRVVLWCLVAAGLFGGPARAQAPTLVQAVAGIVSFTRWPSPPSAVMLCVIGPAAGVDALFATPIEAGGVPLLVRRVRLESDPLDDCHAVYVGRLTPVERRLLLRRLEGRAVLTMGEAGGDCVELTMFCLTTDAQGVSFTTNIDMIARGGVRLNPRVLMLGRRP